jgi:1-acyl-sn-glycerol-3-phosphate acyltransferase
VEQETPESQLERLIAINTEDILGAVGLKGVKRGRQLLNALCHRPARTFARQVLAYDQQVGCASLFAGAQAALPLFMVTLAVEGETQLPASGPLLILANHPGLTDTLALFASIPRPDLRTIAADRPFLRALPNTSQRLIFVNEKSPSNLGVVRQAATHLRAGGAILTFPAGQIEPDPALLPGASASLTGWAESIALLAQLVPATTIVPALVGGVLSLRAQHSPLRLMRRAQKDREWLAAMLQLLIPAYRPAQVQVAFGAPIQPAGDRATLMAHVRAAMRTLIQHHYPEQIS